MGIGLIGMTVSAAFRVFILDQISELGGVMPRSMFGGVGLYRSGVFFGIIAGDVSWPERIRARADGVADESGGAAPSHDSRLHCRASVRQRQAVPQSGWRVCGHPEWLAGRRDVRVATRRAARVARQYQY